MKCVVQQLGARMNYAVPRALHTEGLLTKLVTDLHFERPSKIRRLRGYTSGLPSALVSRDNRAGVTYRALLSSTKARHWPNLYAAEALAERTYKAVEETGADAVYGFDTVMLPSMDRLRRRGTWLAMEQCVAPRAQFLTALDILSAKLSKIGIGYIESGLAETEAYFSVMTALEREEWKRANMVYCPSPFVQSALIAEGVPEDQIRVVPYGVTLDGGFARAEPATSGAPRVVFGGAFSWRKGALEFGRLATALRGEATFEAFGKNALSEDIAARVAADVVRHGHMPRSAFLGAIQSADIFVLPSYMEGSATVIYEAMAMGLACVVSAECGSVISHGKDGLIVRAGDETALQDAVLQLLQDPPLRRELGAVAAETAKRYTRESYGARIAAALRDDFSAHR